MCNKPGHRAKPNEKKTLEKSNSYLSRAVCTRSCILCVIIILENYFRVHYKFIAHRQYEIQIKQQQSIINNIKILII